MSNPTYSVKDWNAIFENAQSRRYRTISWFPVPNHYDTDGYARLMCLENATSLYGAWIMLLGVASRMPVRGILRRREGPLGAPELAARSRGQVKVFERLLRVLVDAKYGIGWLEVIPERRAASLVAASCAATQEQSADAPSKHALARSKSGSAPSVRRPNRTEQKELPAPVGKDLDSCSVGPGPDQDRAFRHRAQAIQARHNAKSFKAGGKPLGPLAGCVVHETTTGESSDKWCERFSRQVSDGLKLDDGGRNRQWRSLMAVANRLVGRADRDRVLEDCCELAKSKATAGMRKPAAAWQAAINKVYPRLSKGAKPAEVTGC